MNILPQRYDDFVKKDYWDKFFRKLKKTSDEYFEWYGEYPEFSELFQILIPTKESKILNLGCGKSLLSEKMYDDGFENILNVDFSDSVIKEMSLRSKTKRPKMIYEVMDIFKMKIENGTFDAVVDKGTLDAVFPEDTVENTQKVNYLFEEIIRILKADGVYLCISLLQEHILTNVLNFFNQKKYDIDLYEVLIKNSKMFPFLLQIRVAKDPESQEITLRLRGKEPQKLKVADCIRAIKEVQTQNIFVNNSKKLIQGQRFSIDIWDQKSKLNVPKFTLHVVDSTVAKTLEKKTCGCFITPQGRESGYLFATERGNFDLLNQTGMSRLIIAVMNPGHEFASMKAIQAELNDAIISLIPKDCANPSVPFMTDGDEIGDRVILYQDDDLIVEEHIMEDEMVYRSLRFSSNLNQIQSQCKLKYFDLEDKKGLVLLNHDSLLPSKKGRCVGCDDSFLSFENHRLMIAGLSLIFHKIEKDLAFKVLILGAGAGIVGKFMTNYFPKAKVDMVEISPKIIEIAEKYFEFRQTDNLKMICADALVYIDDKSKSQSTQQDKPKLEEEKAPEKDVPSDGKYDVIIIDINNTSKSDRMNPPREFVDPGFLKKLKSILSEEGLLMYNIISPDKSNMEDVLKTINSEFDIIYFAQPEGELNSIVYAINYRFPRDTKEISKEQIVMVEENKLVSKKALESSFKALGKALLKQWDTTLNLESYVSEITLKYPSLYNNPFQKSNAYVTSKDNEATNNTKEMYLEDLEKVNKSKRKKKKNKNR